MNTKITSIVSALALGLGLLISLLALLILWPASPVGAQTGSISGDVTYSGSITGTHTIYVVVWDWAHCDPISGPPLEGVGATIIQPGGTYTITGLSDGTYCLSAFLDANDSGGGPADEGEPQAEHDQDGDGNPDPVTVSDGLNTPGIDIVLEDPPPTGAITGTVTEEGVGPIADLLVYADDYDTEQGMGDGNTDATGVYTITGLPSGNYRVGTCSDCSGLDYANEYYDNVLDRYMATQVEVVAPQTTGNIDFVLSQGGAISGWVKDEDGNPITTADISAGPATGEPWGSGTREIDSTGAYTITGLLPGSYKVDARAEGYDQEFYDNQTDWMLADVVTVTAGATHPDINFTLKAEAGGAMEGRVVLPDGAGVRDAWVNAESMEHMRWKGNSTDENGDFRITGITPGEWRVRANPPPGEQYRNYSESEEQFIQVSEGVTLTYVGVITLPTVNVVGRAMMPDGSPASQAPVNIEKTDWSLFTGVGTDHEGYFRKGGLDVGDYRVKLEIPWGTSGIVPPEPRPFTITDTNVLVDVGPITYTAAVKHIAGSVVRANPGEGVPNVEVNSWRRGAEGWAHTQTDSSGDFFLDVSPGDWEVMIHPRPDETVDWVYMGHPKLVTFLDDLGEESIAETKTITFEVESAGARVTGQVVGPNGETLRPWTGNVDIRDMQGRGNGTPLSAGGIFTVSVGAGTYNVWIHVDEQTYPYWSSPHIPPFSIGITETKCVDLKPDDGVCEPIRLIEKTSAITGTVRSGSESGPGVAGVWVHTWQHEGGWADAMTNNDGNYSMSVISGTWEIDVEPPYTSTYVTGQPPQRVDVGDNETKNVNFVLTEAAGVIQGTLKDPSGNVLTDINHGWAYARRGNAPEPVAGAPVDNGQFTLRVPSDTYNVGVWLPPNSGYTLSSEQEVGISSQAVAEMVARAQTRPEVAAANMSLHERQTSVQAGSTVTVTLTLVANDARIVGGFYTDDDKQNEATELMGEVFAMQGMGGAWQSAPIDPTDGSFELEVSAGTWNLGYWIQSSGYVNSPPPDTRVTISSTQVFTFNFTVVATDATIEGVIKKPDNSPLNHAWAHAHRDRTATSAAIDTGDDSQPPDGRFSIGVPSGGQYEVSAHAPEEWGYIQPDFQVVTPTAGSPVNVVLQFKTSNGTINGTVSYHGQSGYEVAGWAWVWAWSDDGQHTGAPTDANGQYQLNVVTGTTWHVGACYQVEQGSIFYETESPTDIVMDTTPKSADLELERAATALPPAVANTFDPSIGWTHMLSDGTYINIPAGAMPTTDTVRISVTPLVEELPNTLTARPFGFGYAIAAYENSTGEQIVQNFNANVLITFYYTDNDLQQRGVNEDDLSPAYFSTTTNSWTKVESFSVDKPANRVTVQINHFSTWGLTSPGGGGQSEIYLPIIMKNSRGTGIGPLGPSLYLPTILKNY